MDSWTYKMKLLSHSSRVVQRRNFSSPGPENGLFCGKKPYSLQTISAQVVAIGMIVLGCRSALCEGGAGLCANSIGDNGLQATEIFGSPCDQLAALVTDQ